MLSRPHSLLYGCQRCHVPVVSEYTIYYFIFVYDVVIKLVHNPGPLYTRGSV